MKFIKIDKTEEISGSEEVLEGSIACVGCGCSYLITKGVVRFVAMDNYAFSFGYEWNKFRRTQLDGAQKTFGKIRFDLTTKWPEDLKGQLILEAGCGAGRFTEIALDRGAEVYSFDLSDAIDAAWQNIKQLPIEHKMRSYIFQADIYSIPLPYGMFDKIFCMGVLQHCPDVKSAYLCLIPFLKPQGELVADCYLKQPLRDMFNVKYIFRPFFKCWKPSWLYVFCAFTIYLAYDIKLVLSRIPIAGRFISKIIPIGPLNYGKEYYFSKSEIKKIKTLSMFDMLSPEYDQPQKISDFRLWMEEARLEILELTTGYNGINARARKKPQGQAME